MCVYSDRMFIHKELYDSVLALFHFFFVTVNHTKLIKQNLLTWLSAPQNIEMHLQCDNFSFFFFDIFLQKIKIHDFLFFPESIIEGVFFLRWRRWRNVSAAHWEQPKYKNLIYMRRNLCVNFLFNFFGYKIGRFFLGWGKS